jgi:hypothetical protein
MPAIVRCANSSCDAASGRARAHQTDCSMARVAGRRFGSCGTGSGTAQNDASKGPRTERRTGDPGSIRQPGSPSSRPPISADLRSIGGSRTALSDRSGDQGVTTARRQSRRRRRNPASATPVVIGPQPLQFLTIELAQATPKARAAGSDPVLEALLFDRAAFAHGLRRVEKYPVTAARKKRPCGDRVVGTVAVALPSETTQRPNEPFRQDTDRLVRLPLLPRAPLGVGG